MTPEYLFAFVEERRREAERAARLHRLAKARRYQRSRSAGSRAHMHANARRQHSVTTTGPDGRVPTWFLRARTLLVLLAAAATVVSLWGWADVAAADPGVEVVIKTDTSTVAGTSKSDVITIRLKPGDPDMLKMDSATTTAR